MMERRATSSRRLLKQLLKPLMDEWGPEEVAAAVSDLSHNERFVDSRADGTINRVRFRLSAREELLKTELLGNEEKQLLLPLAERYDAKQFLPSVADVREFLMMMGIRPAGMKDRREAFRNLLKGFGQMPTVRIREIAEAAAHAGPSELGPLSDAIAAASNRMRGQRRIEEEGNE
jgi:hypothetical protein